MSAKPKSIKETLVETIRVEISGSAICTVPPPEGSPRWAHLEGRRVAAHVLAKLDLAALVEERAELAAHELVMLRAQALRHPAVTYAVEIQWRAGIRTIVDAAWKDARGQAG